MRLWSYTRREVGRRPGRSVLTLLGVVIGVAALVSVVVTSTTTSDAYEDMFNSVGGRASLEVVAEGQGGFDPGLVTTIQSTPGVEAAVPAVRVPGALRTQTGRLTILVLGVDPERDRLARDYPLASGETFFTAAGDGASGALMDGSFAAAQGLEVGDSISLITPTGLVRREVIGLLQTRGAAAFNGGAVVFLPLADAQQLFGFSGKINIIDIVLEDNASPDQVQQAVTKILPVGLSVQTPSTRGQLAQDTLLTTQQGLSAISLLAVVAGGFIILNSFLMSVGERRKRLATLRALGASRAQIRRLLLREAAILGVVGSIIGVGVGLLASMVLTAGMQQLLGVSLPGLRITAAPLILGLVVGICLSLLATYFPARHAGRISPLEGLVGEEESEAKGGRKWSGWLGIALVVVSLAFVPVMATGKISANAVGVVMALLLIGLVLAIPLVLGPLTKVAGVVLTPILGTPGRLAFRQLDRHRTRTALTVGVLFVAVSVGIGMGTSIINNIRDTGTWYERTIVGDYFVRGVLPEIGTLSAAAMPEDLENEIASLEGVERVDKLRFLPGRAGGYQVAIMPRTFDPDRPLPLDLVEGDPESVRAGLQRGEIVAGTLLATRLDVGPGDSISVETRQGPQELRVAGVVDEYTGGGSALYMDWDQGKRLFDVGGVDVFLVRADPAQVTAVGEQLRVLTDENGLLLQSFTELREFIDGLSRGVVAFLWVLLALVFVVASLGVVNTLTMNVLEQSREIGLLRAVAMTRRQIVRTVLSQAAGIGVIAAVPGMVIGVALAYLLNRGTDALAAHPVPFTISPTLVIGAGAIAVVIAIAAAYFPARRAARFEVVKALQYE